MHFHSAVCTDCAIDRGSIAEVQPAREKPAREIIIIPPLCATGNWRNGWWSFRNPQPWTAPSLPLLLVLTSTNPIHPSSISTDSSSSTSREANRENIRWARNNRNYLFSTKLFRQVLHSLPGAPSDQRYHHSHRHPSTTKR